MQEKTAQLATVAGNSERFSEVSPSVSSNGGADGIRTHDLLDAIEARSQLRHGPIRTNSSTHSPIQAPTSLVLLVLGPTANLSLEQVRISPVSDAPGSSRPIRTPRAEFTLY
jgi:hypothetical protein